MSPLPTTFGMSKPDLMSNSVLLSRGVISLPMYPELKDLEVEYIADKVDEFFGE